MHGLIQDDYYFKKESEKDKLRMSGGAWSINLDEIDNQKIAHIVYFTDKYTYRISYDKAFDKGFIRTMAGEKKLIVPIKYWRVEVK